jgi:hypothetical protein
MRGLCGLCGEPAKTDVRGIELCIKCAYKLELVDKHAKSMLAKREEDDESQDGIADPEDH